MPNEEDPAGAARTAETGPVPAVDGPGQPLFRVVAGQPTHDEVAALAAALAARRAAAARASDSSARPAPSAWSSRSRLLGTGARPGSDTWRRSFLPR